MKSLKQLIFGEMDTLLDVLPDITFLSDREGNILYANRKLRTLVGLSQEKMQEKNIMEFFAGNDPQKIIRAHKKLRRGKDVKGLRLRARVKGGKVRSYEVNSIPLERGDSVIAFFSVARDVTGRIKAEKRIKQSLAKSNFYKDLLAHDMANILNNIKSASQMLEMEKTVAPMSEKDNWLLRTIKEQIERGASLISNLKTLSILEKKAQAPTSVKLESILKKAIDYIYSQFGEEKVKLDVIMPQKTAYVKGGELLLDVFENILLNGCVHNTSEIIRIIISVSRVQEKRKQFFKVEFKDNGIGISEGRKSRIFERSYEKEAATGGMGLGLTLVKKIVEGYGGEVRLENRVEKDYTRGSNFIILLRQGHRKSNDGDSSEGDN